MSSDRTQLAFAEKDAALREDVSLLGALVGEMLAEQGGQALFDSVESARRAAIRRRERPETGDDELHAVLAGLPRALSRDVIRAFSSYFQVVNLAEQVHRVRRRRDYLREAGQPQRGSLEDTLREIAGRGLDLDRVLTLLRGLEVQPVFTAHPTEPTRRTILRKHQRIARQLVERFDPSMTPQEQQRAMGLMRAEITSAWQTEEHPSQRMTVADEREHVLFFLTEIIYRVIPVFYENLQQALTDVFGGAEPRELPVLIRFASWVGGDMDGNPNVNAATITASLQRHRALIVSRYHSECFALSEQLSQSLTRVGFDPELTRISQTYAAWFPDVHDRIHPRHRDMPYRVFLRLMAARLQATYDDGEHRYERVEDFVADVERLQSSLHAHGGRHAGYFGVRRLLWRARTFGFHLATLDVRQESSVHQRAVADGLREASWLGSDSKARTRRLCRALANREVPAATLAPQSRETLAVFESIAACRRRFGDRAIGPYIISMARGADDVLCVLLLARWGGLVDAHDQVPLDVAPLFETVTDLQQSDTVMRELFRDSVYREHLRGRDQAQTVMVGYSDSGKDGGLAAARWALQGAQTRLGQAAHEETVDLTLFHGRGGTISRGGGKTHTAILAAPPHTLNGRLRATEQGEMINAKYGLRGIALRNLERAASSLLLATATASERQAQDPSWHPVMDILAAESRRRYRGLVYESPGFLEYFRHVTPIDVIERMQIGSRPSSRRSSARIEDLRAIPWVFAWTQNRCILPGWYGVGSGLRAAAAAHGESVLEDMFARSLFVRALLEDLEMVLAKCDLDIAARYDALAPVSSRTFFPDIRGEFELTVEMLLRLKGATRLLEDDPTLQRAVRLRNPYVDPMSLLQVELLARWRRDGSRDDDTLIALLASVNGIAHGLQNTG